MRDKRLGILRYLADEGPATVDEYLAETGLYVNSVAPVFTALKDEGLIRRTGEERVTRYGGTANVLAITSLGLGELYA